MSPHAVTFIERCASYELALRLGGLTLQDQERRDAELKRLWELVPLADRAACGSHRPRHVVYQQSPFDSRPKPF